MKSLLLNLAATVSLLLAVAIVTLWVRSDSRGDLITREWCSSSQAHIQVAASLSSEFKLMMNDFTGGPRSFAPTDARYEYQSTIPNTGAVQLQRWFPFPPVSFSHNVSGGSDVKEFTIAYWLLLLPTLPLPLLALVHHRRRRRRETNNLCPTCGYDLRATPDRCPECGAVSASAGVREASA